MDLEWSVRGEGGGSHDPRYDGPLHTVHLLDQHSDWLLCLNEYLSAAGFCVTASSDTTDALQVIARAHPEVLIADKDMPDLQGVELLERVRAVSPATRVVLTTEKMDRRPGDRDLKLEGVDLVVKPFSWDVLMRAVERAVRK